MVQQFYSALKRLLKRKDRYLLLFMIVLSVILIKLFTILHLNDTEAITQLLNNLFQFSGIFSGILITYVISKVFQIRQERSERQKEVVKLSNKLTDFRRIARVLVQCIGFWDKEMWKAMEGTYKKLSFFDIKDWNDDNDYRNPELKQLRDKFHSGEGGESLAGSYLYLDMKSLVLDEYNSWQLELYDHYDKDFTYPIEILEKWTTCNSGGNLWYCLSNKWFNYKKVFDFSAFSKDNEQEIIALATKINSPKFRKRKFDNDLLADIGTDMGTHYLPRLYELTYYNSLGLPNTLIFILTILFSTIISGVLAPLLLTSVKVDSDILIIASSLSVNILCLSLFYFLFRFKKILTSEITL